MAYRTLKPVPSPAAAAFLASVCAVLLGACDSPPGTTRVSNIRFTDVSQTAGLDYTGPSYAASVADVNRDGWPDIAFSRHRAAMLLINREGRFESHELYRGDIHGISWLDWNDDGWPDLYITRGADRGRDPGVESVLFLNQGGDLLQSEMKSAARNRGGRGRSATPWDIDRDGRLDLFVLNYQGGQLLIPGMDRSRDSGDAANWRHQDGEVLFATRLGPDEPDSYLTAGNGGGQLLRIDPIGRMKNITRPLGLFTPDDTIVSSLVPFDADNDGDLDLYSVLSGEAIQGVRQIGKRLYFKFTSSWYTEMGIRLRMKGGARLMLVAEGNRQHQHGRFGNGYSIWHYPVLIEDNDRRLAAGGDLVEANKPGITIWSDNPGELRVDFRADTENLQAATGWIEPVDGEIEFLDSYNLNNASPVRANQLFINYNGRFFDQTTYAGTGDSGPGQDAVAADFDQDGDLDLYVVNGRDIFGNPPNVMYENVGHARFQPVTDQGTLAGSTEGRGSSVVELDFDRDGDLDLFITNGSGPAPGNKGPIQLLRNDSTAGHWIQVGLKPRVSNTMGLGARLVLETDGKQQTRVVQAATGRLSTSWQVVHFGMGESTRGRLSVEWPNGARSVHEIQADQVVTIPEPGE